ncbi:Mss4-like protein [Truncatella angustata]|uniref:Mss4-like protein n=1 Tax=Truncatella angustata TaxID=152316 RepID=A0A9P9A3Q5_9PEZI|nr:Mss4-like protein [Truncatella angustata]KAH6659495.1 Mss4-like protein [Truncatella angustata]KAH8196521.1 hypothetical protein TruAng_009317 [Truncatella angustata]
MADQAAPLKTYRGNCHCKAHVFEVRLPELKSLYSCNCSSCTKKGILWCYPEKQSDFTWIRGDEGSLADYAFGKKGMHYKFCPTCGVSLFCIGYFEPPQPGEEKNPAFALNARTFQDLDIWSLETKLMDGASYGAPFKPAKYAGHPPQAAPENASTYHGSCHCGAVRVAMNSSPLGETHDGRVVECDCSICGRYGAIWAYPREEYVAFEGEENLSYYKMGNGLFNKGFCRVCGVPVENKAVSMSEEQKAALSEVHRSWHDRGHVYRGLNSRVLNDVDLGKLKKERVYGWKGIPPQYENP